MTAQNDKYFDLKGLEEYSSLSISTLRAHIRADGLPAYLIGGKVLVKRSEFDSWVSRHRVGQDVDINKVADEMIEEIKRETV